MKLIAEIEIETSVTNPGIFGNAQLSISTASI